MKYKTTPTYAKCIQRFVMFLFLNLLALGVNDTLYAQCDGYDEVSVTSGNYTFQSGERYAFKSATPTTITLSDVTFQNGTAVCVGPNVTLIIQNNINASGAVTLNVEGILQFNQAINFNANLDMTIAEGGVFQTGNNGTVDFNIGGSGVNRILNSGEVKVGVLTFASGSSTNTIDNSGTFTISRNINISGDTEFRNQKDIYVGASFNCNATSVYVNCGVIETATGFNLGGGRVVNTGSFISNNGSIDFGSSTARFENYGIVQVEQVNFSGVDSSLYGGFYNEGSVILDNNFQASGNILGPTDNSKLGYFELANASTLNSGTIGPNLNFKRTTGPSNATSVFGSNAGSLTILSGVVYDCESGTCAAEKVSAGLPCPDLSGNFPAISLVKTGVFQDENGDGRTQVGETIDYTFEITNTGQKVLRDIVIEDGKLGLGTLSVPGTLDPGESTTATASYSVIAADLTTGSVYNEATVRGIDELDTEVSATDDFTVFFNNYCSGVDTDGDGIPDNCDDDDDNDGILDADEGNSSVAVLANPSQATVNDLNNTGTGLFELNVPGPASLASGGVRVSVLSYNNSNPNPNKWRIFQPVLDNGIININGGDVEFATEYLDVINGIPRTVEFDYGQSASELSTTTSKYRYVVGIAGLGGPSTRDELGVDIANVTLRVIGNVDVFDTDTYSTFAGNTPPERNTLGNTITSSEPRVFQGYTFFYIDDEDVSKFEIEFQNEDPHGIIFGVLEERFRDTDGDGIVDSKDVDSDNDGCPDAIEGAGSFNKTHLTADLNLANTPDGVDEFGVPTIAGSPQGNTQAVIDDSISACYVPTAIDDERQVSLNTSLNIDVLANDDFGGDGPSETQPLIITEQPANGSVVLNDNGTPSNLADDTIVYTPNQDYDGVDTFKYKIVDLDGDESEATVEITISDVIVVPPGERGCDCAPLYSSTNFKNPTLVSGSSGQVGAVYRFSNVFLDSPEPIDALVRIEAMRNGATLANIDVTGDGVDSNFQPQLNSTNNGDQNIEFDITFVESGGTYGDEVVISFFATPFDIDGDSVQTREYAELTLSDAYYQSGNTLINIERRPNSVRGTAVNASTAPGGDISTDPRYTFSTYYEGRSSLKYIIGKQNGNIDRFYSLAFSNANYTNPQSYIVTAPVICGNVSDEGGQPLSGVSIKIEGSDGSSTTLTTNSNGDYRYATAIPSALVDVVYTIIETDLDGYVSVDDAEGDPTDNVIVRTINLISSCQNNFVDDGRPEANDDSAEVSPLRPVQPIDIDVLANDNFGPDGPSTGAITTVSQPSLGSAEVNNAGTPNDPTDDYITYIPPSENLVTVTFKYQICDEDGDCDDALVTVTVSDDNPIAEDDNYTVSEDSRDNVLDILSNDYFGNDGAGSVSVLSGPANGVVVLNDNNTPGDVSDDFYEYTPNADFFGTDSFQYQICDGDTPVGDRDCDVATVTILVEADPTLSVDPVTVTEGDPLTFTFSINTVSAEDIVINVNTSDDTAIAGLDYTAAVNQLITIPAGQLSVDFVVNSLEDQIYEVAESFNISGAVQTNNTRNLNVATTGTITDNDGDAPTLSISDVSVVEGVDAVFAVSLDKPSFESITVSLATAEGTALDPEDYTGYSGGSITFAPGETSKNITIATIDDAIYEVTENFTLNGEVTSGTTVNTTASGTGTITDNDGDAPTLSISDVSVVEGVDAVFAVSLDKPSFESITVALATVEGTALDPEDYTGYTGGAITFAPGETSKNITIVTIDDAIYEVDENFTLNGEVTLGTTANTTTSGTGTITDNDGNGPTISIADVTVAEGDDAVFYVTTDQVSFEDIVVAITFADVTATSPEDYTYTNPLQVTIPAGSTTSEAITVPTVDDAIYEVTETFTITGTVSSGTTANTTTSGTGTITDNDGNGPTISIADVTVAEGDDAVFYVTTDQVSFEDIVVDITFADGTATNPADYRDGTPLQVTIPAGSTTSEGITFPTINDTAFEDDETFIVVGTVVAGTTSNATTRGTGTIISNEILAINDINDTFEGQPVSGDVGTNDENPDGPAGSEVYTVLTQPTNGTLVFNPDGTYTYTPNDGFIGEDTFSYEVCDGGSPQACDNADVVIQVLPMEDERDVNEPPVANDDTVITESGVPATGNVLVNDFDPDGDTITVTGNTQPTNGSVTVNPDGTFAYTPELGFTGEDSFEYTVCDDGAPSECTTGTVTIEVTPDYGNSTVANDDAYFGLVDNTISGNVLDNDFDPEGQSQQVDVNTTPLNGPSNGTLVINPDGSFTYTPNAGFIGTDQFTYQISDTGSPVATDVATVYISVRGSDLEPLVASLSLEKVGVFNDENGDQRPQVGETISYTFTVYNTGEVTITDIVIEDPLVDVTGGPIDLAPGEVDGTTFTATYAITQSDIEQLFVENQALVTGEAPDGEIIEDLSDDPNNSDDVDANGDGEPDDVTITIIPNVLSDEDIVIYNVMTPNGDGLNDIFMIENIDDYPDNKVQIFNRWGVEVYSTEGYSIDNDNVFRGFSDGRATVRRGERLPTGTYYYIIEYADPDTGEVRRKASFLYIN